MCPFYSIIELNEHMQRASANNNLICQIMWKNYEKSNNLLILSLINDNIYSETIDKVNSI